MREEWGCDAPSAEWKYWLGSKRNGDPITVDRCPNALVKQGIVIPAANMYGAYKQGITPCGRGLMHETAFYGAVMGILEQLEGEAEGWYMDQLDAKAQRSKPDDGKQ